MTHAGDGGPAIGPQVIFAIDGSGVCTLSAGAGLDDLGLAQGELVGRNLYDVYRDDEGARAAITRALAGETFSTESDFGGRRLWVFYQPIRDEQGAVTGALGVSTDVTEQRRLEAEARLARERASLLADLSGALAPQVRDLGELLQVAARSAVEAVAEVGGIWLRTTGPDRLELRATWATDEVLRQPYARFVEDSPGGRPALDLEDLDAVPETMVLDLETPRAADVLGAELLRRARDFGLSWLLRVPLLARGDFLGMLDVARGLDQGEFDDSEVDLVSDIAERCALAVDNALLLEARRDAREELVKFQALADASDDFIVIADDEGRLQYANPALEGIGAALESRDLWSTVAVHAGDDVAAELRSALGSSGRWAGDIAASFPGRDAVVHAEIFRLTHPETGASLGMAGLATDVTEVRATEQALRAAIADMRQFKALVETSPDFIAIAGLDGKVKYVNPRGREMVGMDPDVDVTTTSIPDYLTPEGLDASLNVEQPAVIEYGHWEGESTLRDHRGGPPIPVAIASFLMPDAETGEPFALATVQRDISERLRAESALHELADQREALLTRLVDAQEAERTRIAADVHDDPVQALAAVELRLSTLRRLLRDKAPELADVVEPLQESVSGATERLRALLFDLEPPDLGEGLAPALRRAAEEIFSSSGVRWSVDGEREPDAPEATRAVAYRIAKEAMTNVGKHSRAENVLVAVGAADGGILVCVEDDGVGVGPGPVESSPGHRGLSSMRDRAVVAGGRCSIENRPGGGTVVTTWLPGIPAH